MDFGLSTLRTTERNSLFHYPLLVSPLLRVFKRHSLGTKLNMTANQRIDRTSLYLFGSHRTKLAVNAKLSRPWHGLYRVLSTRDLDVTAQKVVAQLRDTTGMEDHTNVQDNLPNGCTIFWLVVIARTEQQLNLLIARKPKNKHLPQKVLLLA